MGNYKISDEERQRRSERAKKMREEGKLGGKDIGQGRKKKPRTSEYLSQKSREEAENMYRSLKKIIKEGSPNMQLNAIRIFLETEKQEEQLKIKEKELAYSKESKEEITKLIAKRLKELKEAGVKIPDYIDVEATEIKGELEDGRG